MARSPKKRAKLGLATPGKGLGIAIADFDRDGKIDLAVANDSMPEFLFHNKGDGTFEETGLTAEIAVDGDGRTYAGMGIDFEDFDNDGLPDLVITNLANQKYALYRNNGDGSFTYDTYVAGLAPMTLLHSGWGIHFLDYDNDGLKDLLIAQGHDLDTVELNYPQMHYSEPMLLARNMGNGTFVDVSAEFRPGVQRRLGGSWHGRRRSGQRRPAGCRRHHQWWPGSHTAQRNAHIEPLAFASACRAQEQPRRHRSGDQADDDARLAVLDRFHRRQLSVFERQARAFWTGPRHRGGVDRDSLAQRHSAEAGTRGRRSRAARRGAFVVNGTGHKGGAAMNVLRFAGSLFLLLLLLAFAPGANQSSAQQPTLQSLPSVPSQPTAMPEDTVARAHRLIDAGHPADAETLLREALRADPRSPEANAALAYCLLRENKPAEALKQYTATAALRTPDAAELVNVGQAYVLLGDMPDADRWTLRAIRMSPNDAEAWYSLGRIRFTEQRFGDALACFQRALALSPHNAKVENNLGLAEEGLNHTDEAIAAYRQAIAWESPAAPALGSEQPYLNLAIVLLHRGQLAEAQTLLTRAIAISPYDPRILEQLGHLHLQQGDAKAAAEAFGQAVHLDPGNSGLHFLLGQSYRRLGESNQAQAEFAEAARLARAPKSN